MARASTPLLSPYHHPGSTSSRCLQTELESARRPEEPALCATPPSSFPFLRFCPGAGSWLRIKSSASSQIRSPTRLAYRNTRCTILHKAPPHQSIMTTARFPGHSRTTSTDFSETSLVETVVPAASAADLQQSLGAWDGTINEASTSILPFLSQRQFLFFGMRLELGTVLKQTSYSFLGI